MDNVNKALNGKEGTLDKKSFSGITTRDIVCVGMFAAVLAILSQITIPMPSSVPITLQTFAVALTGFVLAWKLGTASTLVYILIGAIGVPVFSGFSGGVQRLVGYTGGFIWGFIIMVFLCGVAVLKTNKAFVFLLSMAGLAICHLLGVIQFMIVTGRGFAEAFLLASAPYIIKDVISVILAYAVGMQIRKRLIRAGLLYNSFL